MSIPTITPARLADLCRGSGVTLIDVRTPAEFASVHAPTAVNVPLERLDPAAVRPADGGTVYVICQSGGRGRLACERLRAAGLDAANVDGGTAAWAGAGLPVVRGRKAISLERQVRIAAGLLVLLGVILGFAVHPWLVGLSGFVGAGLVFAGLTDTCGMGLLLARLPWNRRGQGTCSRSPAAVS